MIVYWAFTFAVLMVGAKTFTLLFVEASEVEILKDAELFLHVSVSFFPILGLLCILRYTCLLYTSTEEADAERGLGHLQELTVRPISLEIRNEAVEGKTIKEIKPCLLYTSYVESSGNNGCLLFFPPSPFRSNGPIPLRFLFILWVKS